MDKMASEYSVCAYEWVEQHRINAFLEIFESAITVYHANTYLKTTYFAYHGQLTHLSQNLSMLRTIFVHGS
jgi:hypothetical protein